MFPIPNYLKNIINLVYDGPIHCKDRSIQPHHNKIHKLAEKILTKPNNVSEQEWIQLAEEIHFIPNESIKTDLINKLGEATKGILNPKDPTFKKIQPQWNNFWGQYEKMVKLFPEKDQDSAFLKSMTTTLSNLEESKIALLNKIIAGVPEHQRKTTFAALSKYISDIKSSTLSEIANLPPSLIQQMEDNSMLEQLISIPEEEQASGFQAIEELLKNAQNSQDKGIIIEIVSKLSKTDKEKIVEMVNQYPIANLTPKKKMDILLGIFLYPDLSSIQKMSNKQKLEIVKQAQKLRISQKDQAVITIKKAKPFIRSAMSPSEISEILDIVKDAPFIQSTISLSQVAKVSSSFDSLTEDQRKFFLYISLVIVIMKSYGNQDSEMILQDALPFINKEMPPSQIAEVCSLMASIPKDKRKAVMEEAQELLPHPIHWSDPMIVLYILTKTPSALRAECLKELKSQLPTETPIVEKMSRFLELASAKKIQNFSHLMKYKESPEMEEDFENMTIGPEFLLENKVPMPNDSLFANTDLIVFNDNVKALPLNGIRKSELEEIENLAQKIFSGKANLTINSENPQFQKDVQGYIITLLTRPLGRKLIKKVLENTNLPSLPIKPGEDFSFNISEISIMPTSELKQVFYRGLNANAQIKIYPMPNFLILGHELIHASRFPKDIKMMKHKDSDYGDKEEKLTITGTTKDLQLPDSLLTESSPQKMINFDEKWDEDIEKSVFNEDNFDLLNERNLNAQFTDSKNVFYPRSDHNGHLGSPLQIQDPIQKAYAKLETHIKSTLEKASTPTKNYNTLLASLLE